MQHSFLAWSPPRTLTATHGYQKYGPTCGRYRYLPCRHRRGHLSSIGVIIDSPLASARARRAVSTSHNRASWLPPQEWPGQLLRELPGLDADELLSQGL